MITHSDDHLTDVCKTLGIKATGESRMAGIEIETGWTSDAKRKAFFRDLERRGVGEQCISKHDGTIGRRGETYVAEIVSAPLPFHELRKFTESVGKAIESGVDRGLITSGCGIHIHVSEGLFDPDTLWRYAASICQSPDHAISWAVGADNRTAANGLSRQVKQFFDDICLRGETQHSKRTPYKRVGDIPKTTDHSRAVIHGRATPTFETRIFRTPKSRRVLGSYVDIVEALHHFSLKPPEGLTETNRGPSSKEMADLQANMAATLGVTMNPNSRECVYFSPLTGDQYTKDEIQTVVNRGGNKLYYPHEKFLYGKRIPSEAELRMLDDYLNSRGALGWTTGTIPLNDFVSWVQQHSTEYPNLAKRLTFDKFKKYSGGFKDYFQEHVNKEHTEYQPGCIVRVENSKGELWTICNITPGNPVRQCELEYNASGVRGDHVVYPINVLIHACKGATELGGEV